MMPFVMLVMGILSGFLTAAAARFLDLANPLVGVVFGTAITLMVWLKHKNRPVWIAVALISSSVTSYLAAVWGTLALTGLVGRSLGPESHFTDPTGAATFAVAGFVGALIINVALLLLVSPVRGLRLLGRAAAWASAGALLGFVGSELSGPMGAAVATVVGDPPSPGMGSNDHFFACYSAYLIWQPGIAFLIPLMLRHSAPAGSDQPVSLPRSPAKLSILGKLFFCSIFATLLLAGYFAARDRYRDWSFQHESAKLRQEIPSVDNLPVIAPKPPEQMLVLHEIAGYVETGAKTVHVGIKGPTQHLVDRIIYSDVYKKTGNTTGPADQRNATAIVAEFPNTEWASFEVKDGPPYDSGPYLYMTSTRTAKFGHPIMSHTMTGEHDLCVFWPSSNKVVVIYYPGEEAEEIVKQYLAKYPSSL